jgi:hypothetical protein
MALAAATIAIVCAVGGAGALTVDGGAAVVETAARGSMFQATETVPPASGCRRVIVIGDSLMDNSRPWLVDGLDDAGFDAYVDAQPSRRIPASVRAPYSGVTAAADARATFGEADCWVVALGSNDLVFGAGVPAAADAVIDEMLAAVTPGASVWWVNVNYHRDPDIDFGFAAATAVFNRQVAARADADPALAVIDWYALSEANLQWFFDPVHVDRTGSIARAGQTVAALPRAG